MFSKNYMVVMFSYYYGGGRHYSSLPNNLPTFSNNTYSIISKYAQATFQLHVGMIGFQFQ